MSEDIVALLRILNHHAKKLAENESLHDLHRDAFTRCEDLTGKAERDIVQLRQRVADLRGERDDARRLWCEVMAASTALHPEQIANRHGWDCFKEKP